MPSIYQRLAGLPRLGVGISAEPDSWKKGIDTLSFRAERPDLVHFLEFGTDLSRGLDAQARGWAAANLPATYHFLDLNLEERGDLDADWIAGARAIASDLRAAWVCGDAGRWHFGPRDRGHQILLPPILTQESAAETADAVRAVEEALGCVVLPENPPSHFYVGDLHILDYFAEVSRRAECGLLLDCAHLAIYQRLAGLPPLAALDGFPLDRVVEIHVAGGHAIEVEGLPLVEDGHGPVILDETWEIVDHVIPRARNLKAVIFECEKNPTDDVIPTFEALNRRFPARVGA